MKREVAILIKARDMASRGFARVSRSGQRMTGKLQQAGAGLTSQFQSFGKIGMFGIMKIVGAVGALIIALKSAQAMMKSFIQTGIMGNAQMEALKVTLASTFKDMKKATEALAWATKFAAKTPFQIPEVVQATVRLETYGLKAKETLRIIGDMASIMGKPLMQAIEAIADAQVGELERMKEFGITKRMLIEAGAKVNTRGAIKDMESLNKALMRIMEERFAGGMEKMSHTFRGITSNLKDFWGTLQRQLSEPAFEVIKWGLKDLLGWINKVKASAKFDEVVKGIGQAIGKFIRLITKLPKVFQLLIAIFISFIKKLGDWEYATRAIVEFSKFALITIGGMFDIIIKLSSRLGKIVWKPLEVSFLRAMVNVVQAADMMKTAVWFGFKWLGGKVVWLFNKVIDGINFFVKKAAQSIAILLKGVNIVTRGVIKATVELERLVTGIELPKIPDIPVPEVADDFDDMYVRMMEREKQFSVAWKQNWQEAGKIAKEEVKGIAKDFREYMLAMKYAAGETIIPLLKEAIPPELLAQLKAIGIEINAEIVPALMDMGAKGKKAEGNIRKAAELDKKAFKARTKALQEWKRRKDQADKEIFRRTLELSQSEKTMFEWGLTEKVHQYRQAGVSQNWIDRWLYLERVKFMEDNVTKTVEANEKLKKSSVDTWESITGYIQGAMGVGKRLLQSLMGMSQMTWQEMIADVIEWGGHLVAQYLLSKGLEMMRRAEIKKTQRVVQLALAEELSGMAVKLGLAGDYIRAGIAGVAAAAAAGRAAALTTDIQRTEAAGKKYIALGLAVEAGTMIASEALKGWGQRATDARQRQEDEMRKTQQDAQRIADERAKTEQRLQDEIIGFQRGAQAKEAVLMERRRQEYSELGIDPQLLQAWSAMRQYQIAGMPPAQQPYTQAQPLPVQIISIPGTEPEHIIPITSPTGAGTAETLTTRGQGLIINQTNYFEGLVNFDNPAALRELASKLHPFWDELEENWEA